MRFFFAALPDAATCKQLACAAGAVRLGTSGILVPPANHHLTLAFIGEVAAVHLPVLLEIGGAQRAHSWVLRFDAYEYWPKPQAVVAAARVIPSSLENLWGELHRQLAERHWALDAKRLRPHVTLARRVAEAPMLQALSNFDWPVNEFSLMRSETGHGQSVYTVVDTWSLLDDAP